MQKKYEKPWRKLKKKLKNLHTTFQKTATTIKISTHVFMVDVKSQESKVILITLTFKLSMMNFLMLLKNCMKKNK